MDASGSVITEKMITAEGVKNAKEAGEWRVFFAMVVAMLVELVIVVQQSATEPIEGAIMTEHIVMQVASMVRHAHQPQAQPP
ncbi:MAG: hypothetical protein LBS86_03955 [Treponema sp.]|jgi:hypothetical protein|nr:hypothetical protein [Treponema sp.]